MEKTFTVYKDQIVQFVGVVTAASAEEAEKIAAETDVAWVEYNRLEGEIRDDLTVQNKRRKG